MAASGLDINRDTFSCSICLDLLKDPVSIPCGHSYCMSCIKTHWDGELGKQSYSCPQCRHRFTLRPVLVKNTMLAILMEGLMKSEAPAAPLSPSSAAHGHVFCDLCSGAKVKAVKSCLQCLVSYCKEHLQPHYDVAALKKHKLVEPTENLQENMCSVHDEVMKMFCRTDQQCICYLCSLDQHKGHHTVTAAAERTEKQRELQAFQQNVLQRISHKEKDLGGLHHQLKNYSHFADAAVEHSDRSLKELLHLLEKRMSLVKQQVRSQQEAEEHRVKELQDKVQQEISELKRKLTELDTLSHSEDHVHFLHKFASLSKVTETSESVNSSQSPPPFQDMVTAAVSKLRSSLQETSLLDPPAASNKLQVNIAKTDGLPAEATVASQQRELKPQTLQENIPPPTQSSKKDVPPPQSSQRKRHMDTCPQQTPQQQFNQEDVQPSPQVSEKWPALTRANLKRKPSTLQTACALPAGAQGSTSSQQEDFYYDWPDHVSLDRHVALDESVSLYYSLEKYARKITWDPRSVNNKLDLYKENRLVKHMPYPQNHRPHQFRFTELPQVVSKESLTGQCYFVVRICCEKSIAVAVTYKDIRRNGSSNECRFGMNAKSWAIVIHPEHCEIWHNGRKEHIPKTANFVGVFVDYNAGIICFYLDRLSLEAVYRFKTTFTQPLVAGVRLDDVLSTVQIWD